MKSWIPLFFVFLLVGSPLAAQTKLYVNPDFPRLANDHQTIAILPFKTSVSLRPKQMKDIQAGELDRMEKSEAAGIQMALNSWFLRRKKSGKFWAEVQDVNTTNALLKREGIEYENLYNYTPKELAYILGVDAVIMGDFQTNKPMSEGAGVALALLVGYYGATNNAVMNMFIHNAVDGTVLVNYHKGVSGSIGSTPDQLVNVVMRKASRRIPYTKKKVA